MLILCSVPQSNSFLDSFSGHFLHIFLFLLPLQLRNSLRLLSNFLSLLDLVIEFALNLGNSSSLDLFIELSSSLLPGLS